MIIMKKILKVRYFKHTDIMEADLGTNSLYIWQFIIYSGDLIAKGLRWRVGDDKNIFAFQDTWIPGLVLEEVQCTTTILFIQRLQNSLGKMELGMTKIYALHSPPLTLKKF